VKNLTKLNIIGILILLLGISCTKSMPDGKWDDNIRLSQKEVEISGENNSLLITTEGEWWWIIDITLDETHIDFSGVDTTQSDFVIENNEFKIERENTTEIHIDMYNNSTGSSRILRIRLEAGDYFDGITITQLSN